MPPDASSVRLGQRLRKARLARNLTQSEVAQQRFSVSYISAVERGQIRPSLGALEKLSERLHVPLAELLRDESDIIFPQVTSVEKDGSSEDRDEFESRLALARILARQGHSFDALEVLQSLPNAHLTPRQRAEVLWAGAYCNMQARRCEEARSAIQDAIPFADKANDQEMVARMRLDLGRTYSLMHKYQLALDTLKICQDAIERGVITDPVFRFAVLSNLGSAHRALGEVETAFHVLNQAAELGENVVNPSRLGAMYAELVESSFAARNFHDARMTAGKSLSNFEAADNQRLVGEVHNRLGRAYAQSGQLADAKDHLEQAHQIAEREQDTRGIAEAERGLAEVYVQQQRIEDAAAAASHALTLSDELDDPMERAESLLVHAHVDEAQHNYTAAEKNFKKATELLESTDATQAQSDAYARYSEFLERRGEGESALKLLRKAWRLSAHSAALTR